MNILFDIAHPADVHTYRHVRSKLIEHGHNVIFMARDKDVVIPLLEAYKIPYLKGTKAQRGIFSLSFELIKWFFNAFSIIRKHKVDLAISLSSPSTGWAAKLNGIPHIMFNDTETGVAQLRMARPATKVIYTPQCLLADWGPKQVRYNGLHDLAYLRPEYYGHGAENMELSNPRSGGGTCLSGPHEVKSQGQEKEVLKCLSSEVSSTSSHHHITKSPNSSYAILRLVSWGASHDRGMKKTSIAFQKKICEMITEKMKIFISAEGDLPDELEQYRLKVPPHKLHDAMASAQLVVGDGATTATEAAVLGVPSLYISPFCDSLGYCRLLKEYNLLEAVKDEEQGIAKIKELLENPEFEERKKRKERFLDETIDVVEFITEKIEENLSRKL